MMRRRRLLAGALALSSCAAWAQADGPTKPVKIVVPFAPGSTTDLTARVVAEQLGWSFEQTFVVENKAEVDCILKKSAVAEGGEGFGREGGLMAARPAASARARRQLLPPPQGLACLRCGIATRVAVP